MQVAELKRIAAKLPPIPLDLTPKNKALAMQFESDHLRAKLLFLPEQLMAEVARDLARGRLRFVEAQVAIAIDIDLVIPAQAAKSELPRLAAALQRAGWPQGPALAAHPRPGDQVEAARVGRRDSG